MEPYADSRYVPPHVLTGLEHFVSPGAARQAMMNDGGVDRYSSEKIKNSLRWIAVSIYNHKKVSTWFQSKSQDGAATVAYLLCAAFGQEAPVANEILSLSSFGDSRPFKICHWEGLYYALVAEVRAVYGAIQQHFESDFQHGYLILHNRGFTGEDSDKPWKVLDLASVLEEMWLVLMDPRLLATMDEAVRIEQFSENFRSAYGDHHRTGFQEMWSNMSPMQKTQAVEERPGMVDTELMSPAEILDMVSETHVPLVRRACQDIFERVLPSEDGLVGYHLHPDIPNIPPDQLENTLCTCQDQCHCRLVCQFQVSVCACKEKRNNYRRTAWWQQQMQDRTPTMLQQHADGHVMGPMMKSMARLQVADTRYPMPEMVQVQPTTEAAYHQEVQRSHGQQQRSRSGTNRSEHHYNHQDMQPQRPRNQRQRSNTEHSELAYVPPPLPKTPVRGGKDAFPLGFYDSSPGGRYPQFRSEGSKYPQPVYGPSFYTTNIPARKPVSEAPSPLFPRRNPTADLPAPLFSGRKTDPRGGSYNTTASPGIPPGQVHSPPIASPLSQVYYPPIPPSMSRGLFAQPGTKGLIQSFPVPIAGNSRQPENEFADWDTTRAESPYIPKPPAFNKPKQPELNLPTTDDQLPSVRHSADLPQQPRGAEPRIKPPQLEKALPPVHETLPAFIAPRPALKQRYVSAGGDAKLEDRPVLEDFQLPASLTQGISMPKEELLRALNERRDSAVEMSRSSQDDYAKSDKYMRSSREVDDVERGEKRNRAESNTSSFKKWKRVFSRQNSQCD